MCIKKEALSTKIVALEDGEVNYLLKKHCVTYVITLFQMLINEQLVYVLYRASPESLGSAKRFIGGKGR